MRGVSADEMAHGGEDRVPFAGAGFCDQATNTGAGTGDEDYFLRIHVTSPIMTASALALSSRSMQPNRWRSPAAGSRSEGRAEAGGSQVQCLVRPGGFSL